MKTWQIHTFLWIIFCATCQITCTNVQGNPDSKNCRALKLKCLNDTQNKNHCIMSDKKYSSPDGNCQKIKITRKWHLFKVTAKKKIEDITSLFKPDQLVKVISDGCNNLSGPSGLPGVILEGNTSHCLRDVEATTYLLQKKGKQAVCVTCSHPSLTNDSSTTMTISASKASDLMNGFETIVDEMEKNKEITEEIVMEGVRGLVYRPDRNTEPKDVIMFSSSDQDEINVTDDQNITPIHYSWYVKISAKAFNKSRLENNGSAFVGVLQFKNIDANDSDYNLIVLNNEVYGISMGANISNLTDNIEIFIRARNLVGNVSCNSWDGRGNLTWTTFGCNTEVNLTNIKCSCSHLPFFAVLKSANGTPSVTDSPSPKSFSPKILTSTMADTTSKTMTPSTTISTTAASNMMDDLKNTANEMKQKNQSFKPNVVNGVNGLVYIQDSSKVPKDIILFSSSDQNEITVTEPQNIEQKNYSWYVKISAEAFKKSLLENNGSAFVGVLQFKNLDVNDSDTNLTVLNNEVYGISMGANISNLTNNIEIFIRIKNLVVNMSCNSWDGRGNLTWTTSGCETEIINQTIIKCSCSHLTFFAVLMSIPNANITSPHVDTLTYISYIGCGLSMFFLGIALFMHFLLRKNKSSQSTKILINMFVALFILNLSFLSNESIADTQSSSACTVIALIMHYSMLSTFTWFFLQALHMYFWLIRKNITIKNYMKKMIVSGWVCSCPVVVIIAALGEYKLLIIESSAEKTTRMCWITNHNIHYIVNIGYYSLVFSFTAGVFVMIVAKLIQARNMRVGDVKKATLKTRVMMILSLFVLLGLTWAVAFFSYGDMIIPSYYIFCVLNSFQGFFLFLYYYHIRNDAEGSFSDDPDRSSSTINQSTINTS
ncbi:adhesion G-protein coupled receptor G2-like isoform X2 [Triplophysa dalaica]|uniref:adhesion G-protein coupled receptor G2-like isoform X2 n=1 Tax=Triplophysa dalaica TaxID=1582913 RepID=UPI0024DFDC3F|nr:adhesion G-protein coupled receptor G2-like isoform X2 [Triplophysa dalaica]